MQASRSEAITVGEKYFFTGKPCKRGHLADRYVGNGGCVECLRPKRTALAVISTPGEIVPRSDERLELQRARVDLEQQKLVVKAQRATVELKKLELQLERRGERTVATKRKSIVKTQLVDVILFIDPLDFETVAQLVWLFAVLRNPLLRRDETMTGRELSDMRHVMRCFPGDKTEIVRLTNNMFFARHEPAPGEIKQKLLATQSALDADLQSEWPTHDPR